MKKSILIIFLALFVFIMPVWAQNSESDFEVDLTADMTGAAITRYIGASSTVYIPGTIQGMPVKEIRAAFKNNFRVTSIVIPHGVTTIGNEAFFGCTSLTSVTLPSTITSIGNLAFSGCSALASINLPNNVTYIGTSAFSNSGIISITWPSKLNTINEGMFSRSTSLQNIVISEGVATIGSSAFIGCTALTTVTFPSTLWRIQDSAFSGCSALTTINIPNTIEWIDVAPNAFEGATRLTLATTAALRRFDNTPEAVRQRVIRTRSAE